MTLAAVTLSLALTAAPWLLLGGVSPGTVLVFLLAGLITSLATLGVLQRQMGTSALVMLLIVAVRPLRTRALDTLPSSWSASR